MEFDCDQTDELKSSQSGSQIIGVSNLESFTAFQANTILETFTLLSVTDRGR